MVIIFLFIQDLEITKKKYGNKSSKVKGKQIGKKTRNIMNFLTYADGKNELEVISLYIKKNYLTTKKIYDLLIKRKLII